jgi:homoserine dehydrogenase
VGIIAQLASVLADQQISIDAVLQEPCPEKQSLPFVITVEPTTEAAISAAIEKMKGLDFLLEAPLALPLESALG